MQALSTAGAGFLLAVLWFDLMFDVQIVGRGDHDTAIASIGTYYRRVTTTARPMNRLVALWMVVTVVSLVVQMVRADGNRWMSAMALAFSATAIGIAAARTVRNAVRLGRGIEDPSTSLRLARTTLFDHLASFALMAATLIVVLVN